MSWQRERHIHTIPSCAPKPYTFTSRLHSLLRSSLHFFTSILFTQSAKFHWQPENSKLVEVFSGAISSGGATSLLLSMSILGLSMSMFNFGFVGSELDLVLIWIWSWTFNGVTRLGMVASMWNVREFCDDAEGFSKLLQCAKGLCTLGFSGNWKNLIIRKFPLDSLQFISAEPKKLRGESSPSYIYYCML